jgi:tetratricopeptide (TPR) repeat protein
VVKIITLLLLLLLLLPALTTALRVNLLCLQVQHTLISRAGPLPQLQHDLQSIASDWQRAHWYLAQLASGVGDLETQRQQLTFYLASGQSAAPSLSQSILPNDLDLARLSISLYPMQAHTWIWIAAASEQAGLKEQALQSYQIAVRLRPSHALSWCRIGNLLRPQDKLAARSAYIHCCDHGDPGSNGCYNAARLFEELGENDQALYYYRRSRWEGSHQRADDLQSRLHPHEHR